MLVKAFESEGGEGVRCMWWSWVFVVDWFGYGQVFRIRRRVDLGFDGPFSGTERQFMIYSGHRLVIPSNSEYSIPQLRFMLREIESIIDRQLPSAERDQL